MDLPAWLTSDFLKSCLQSDKVIPEEIEIIGYTAESAVPAGNNYGSHMLRVKIDYNNINETLKHSVSVIVKAPLSGKGDQFGDFTKGIYEREPKFYDGFINETYKLCNHDIVPKHYKSPNSFCVVLEDLKASGYKMVDRHKLLDFDQCKLYIKASCKLHALSVAVHNKYPEVIETLVELSPELAEQSKQIQKGFAIAGLQCMAAFLEEKPKYKEYMDLMREIAENGTFWNIFQEMEESNKRIRALVQGDPWCTNMMFRYNNYGAVEAIKIIDFQNLKLTSPLEAFITFVWLSARPDVRETRLDDLYHLYCDSLNENLAELGCSEKVFFDEIKAEIEFLSPLVLSVVCVMLPICISDGVADVYTYISDYDSKTPIKERPIYQLYQGNTFNSHYPQILDQVAREGVFDYLNKKIKELK